MKVLFPYMARWHAVNWTRYHSLIEALGKQGHEIHVLQPPAMKSDETNFIEIDSKEMPGVVLHDVPVSKFLWERKWPLDKIVKKAVYSIIAYKTAKKLVKEHGIDLLLLYNIPQYQYIHIKNVKIAFDFADDYVDMLKYELGRFALPPVLRLADVLLKRMMRKSSVVLSVSHELAKMAEGNVKVLANGVDTRFLKKQAANVPDKLTIGFIGSFEYFIDFELILNSAKLLSQHHFLLVGSGRQYQSLQSRIKEEGIHNIELTGGVPHDDIFMYIDKMDVCLNIFKKIPVSHRACPIKLFEYLSRCKPVISTRLDELAYIDKDSILYYADSPEELVNAINEINEDSGVIKRIDEGFDLVSKHYTWEHLSMDLIKSVE
ncbi:MAG: glycosyltransferase [Gammaproteobacteria bacterium]|nr:glycosyltransferase [Gammaproteobacteria bacterium]